MISIVIAARNDNYGGDFLERLQSFVNMLVPQLDVYAPDSELVIVEWNPPQGRSRLAEAIRWHEAARRISVRIIEVSNDLHSCLPNSKRMPMFEYFAKNVGIRRTRGDFVLVTNPDILFTAPLIRILGRFPFSAQCFYRIDRYDTTNRIRVNARERNTLIAAKMGIHTVHCIQRTSDTPGSQSIGTWRRLWGLCTDRWPGSHHFVQGGARKTPLIDFGNVLGYYWGLHTNASGDFILASRRSWLEIRGFAEFPDTFTHLDGYCCYQFKAAGLRQMLFVPPYMILHRDHTRADQQTRPRRGVREWQEDLKSIMTGALGPVINGPDWGFGSECLRETVP